MKNFAYTKRQENEMEFRFYEDDQPVLQTGRIGALMMSRVDFNIKKVEIPPVSDDEVNNLLGYKLRSLYPGDPGETSFDFKVISRGKKRFAILFITSRMNVDQYKEQAGKKSFYLPFHIVEPMVKNEDQENLIFLFWDKEWIDIIIFDDKIFHSSTAVRREKEVFLDILKIKNILPSNYNAYKCITLCSQEDLDDIMEKSGELFAGTPEKEFLGLNEVLKAFKKRPDSLFRKKKGSSSFVRKIRIDVLILIVIFLGCLLFNKYVDTRRTYQQKLRITMNRELNQSVALQQNQTLVKQYNTLRASRPMDSYLLFSEVSKIMAGDAIVVDLKIDSLQTTFFIEGIAYNPDKFLNKFKDNKYFKNVVIIDINPDPGINKDRFKMTGEFHVNQ